MQLRKAWSFSAVGGPPAQVSPHRAARPRNTARLRAWILLRPATPTLGSAATGHALYGRVHHPALDSVENNGWKHLNNSSPRLHPGRVERGHCQSKVKK